MADYRGIKLDPVFVKGELVKPEGQLSDPPASWADDGGEAPNSDALKAQRRVWEGRWKGMKIRADERT